ncbi:MAG: DUF998 domain-containing protein [Candidatus Bathyarchaeia archaeon]
MKYENRNIAGLLVFIGGVQCVLGIIIAEALYPGYSTSENWISDLGVGPSALIFNSSVFLLGVLGVAATYFIQRAFNSRVFSVLLAMASIGMIGVGLFTEEAMMLHTIFSLITFIFAGLSAIVSYKLQKPPLSYLSVALGVFALLALVLTFSGTYLGLGKGGMERMIAYPALLWLVGFGGHLIGYSSDTSEATKS